MNTTMATNVTAAAVNGTICNTGTSLIDAVLKVAPFIIYCVTAFSLLTLIVVTASALYSSCRTNRSDYDPDLSENPFDEECANLIKVPQRSRSTPVMSAKYQRLKDDDSDHEPESPTVILFNENYEHFDSEKKELRTATGVAKIEPLIDAANGAIRYYMSTYEDFKRAHEVTLPIKINVDLADDENSSSSYGTKILEEVKLRDPEHD
ncbi:envelope glycoprotein UL132 [Saimiriine betaherpesvirus 4]|uniref:Envelope glycoprotein UL132 n=1 Tax=Saimiriine betaherpesvirus 4 TaxID=1535247 RepID=G8XT24_9BETA|nr:envelope glycoprotein UL132 [Saimiriine betaherpesvirus 4]AEV80979.1 envelope glycoprotein UL132 [Saimiriine betaherpesvirus 4]